jgi:ribosomal-protein-alanine N-acetyltransferase
MIAAHAIQVEKMTLDDVEPVLAIDKQSFPLPWSATSYHYELTQNDAAHFYVAVAQHAPRWAWLAQWLPAGRRAVVGYCGFWLIVDEAHISTIAVHPAWRGHGVGELMLVQALNEAVGLGAVLATLEVRMGNVAAQNLYRKYAFEVVGQRKHYYRDNGEDALLMTAQLKGYWPPAAAKVKADRR